jgi:hypothetical protein
MSFAYVIRCKRGKDPTQFSHQKRIFSPLIIILELKEDAENELILYSIKFLLD